LEFEATGIDLGVRLVKRIIAAVGRAKIAVDAAVGKVLAVAPQEWAFVDELAAQPAAMAVAGAGFGDRLLDVIGLEVAEVKAPGFAQKAAYQGPIGHVSLV